MENIINVLSDEEKRIYNQIENYYVSQNILKKLINYNIQAEIELCIINGQWLDQWKKYSCYDEIKSKLPLKSPTKWREIRNRNKANKFNVGNLNNRTLIKLNNNNLNNIVSINPYADFYFITKECFDAFCKLQEEKDEMIYFKFISYNNMLIYQNKDQIYVIFNNEKYLNFLLIVLNNPNNNDFYKTILENNIQNFVKHFGIDKMDNQEINDINIKKIFNKSFKNIETKNANFCGLIKSLINFNYGIQFNNLQEEERSLYLINEDWLNNFKLKLNYVFWYNKTINDNFEPIIKNMFKEYIKNISENDDIEIINPNNKYFSYLKDNTNNNIIKFYDNYSFINEDIWYNLIKLFNWNTEIKTRAYIIKKNIIIIYNDNNFEVIEINYDNEIIWRLLFCLYNNYKNYEIINEIKNLGINEYLHKYNINIINNNQTSQKLYDNYYFNNCIGIIININAVKNNHFYFTLLNNDQLNTQDLNLGINQNIDINNFNFIHFANLNGDDVNNKLNIIIDNYINKIRKNININQINTNIILQVINKPKKENNINIPNIINHVIQCLKNCKALKTYLLDPQSYYIFSKNLQKYPISLSIVKIMNIDFQNNYNLYNAEIKKLIDDIEKNYNIDIEDPERIYEFILDNIHQENKRHYNQNNIQIPNYIDNRKVIFSSFFDNVCKPENTTKISYLFFGVREVLINCGKCNRSNYDYYIFKYLEFQLEEILHITVKNSPKLIEENRNVSFLKLIENFENKKITLEKCFEFYVNYFKQKNSKYYCKKCSLKNDSFYYNNKIIILPKILCIAIKRNEGNSYIVDYPEKLDISKYLESFVDKKKYELFAVISYYICENEKNYFSLIKKDEKWYNCIENNVQECKISEAKNLGFPYMLFYQQIN